MSRVIRIGNAQGFWGDRIDAPVRMIEADGGLDFLTLDYLAEVSMSILAKQHARNDSLGYAQDFVEVVRAASLIWQRRDGVRPCIVTNAGGLNPVGCARACLQVMQEAGLEGVRIGVVTGDDVLGTINLDPGNPLYCHLESGQSPADVASLFTANAYIGADAVAALVRDGVDMVVAGRVADPSLTVGPCIAHFGWSPTDYEQIAGATIAGHLIECGVQVCGGIATDWLSMPDVADIGYPVVEVSSDGSCVVTKIDGTGGRVCEETVKEQLVYEIGDPGNYLSPDATVSFLDLQVNDEGNDRVSVSGARGLAPSDTYKVSGTFHKGYRASAMLALFGRDAVTKGRRCGEIVKSRLGCEPDQWHVELLGAGDVVPVRELNQESQEVVLRMSVFDRRRSVVERFTREVMPLVTNGPPGVTGYSEGRPKVRDVYGYWPCLIRRDAVGIRTTIIR